MLLSSTVGDTAGAAVDWWVLRHMDPGHSAVVVHPTDPNVLYMTWDTTVSFDGGETWEDLVSPWEHVGSGSSKVREAGEFSPVGGP